MDKTKELGDQSIGKLLAKYSIPAVIAMLVNAIYNVVDRIFIGKFVGEDALAALTIIFPLMLFIFAFASLVGVGAGSLMSIRLGEKNREQATKIFGNALILGLLVALFLITSIFLNMDSLLYLFGATTEILPVAKSYMNIILIGAVFQMIAFILNNTVRLEGQPMIPMIAMMSSAITNIILDYIFIVLLGWGVNGAALATILGQFLGFVILISFYLRGRSSLHITKKDLIPNFKIVKQISTIGFSTFIGTAGMSIAMIFFNRSLSIYGGVAAITSMGAINSLYTLFIMPIMGIQQGLQPIVGYNYGAKKYSRSFDTLKVALIVSFVFATIVYVLLQLFPEAFLGMFIDPMSNTIAVAKNGLKVYTFVLPLLGINILGIAFFQATGQAKEALFLSLLKEFIVLFPLVLILPNFLALNGVWLAKPISDAVAIIVTIFAIVIFRKKILNNNNNTVVKEAV